MTTNARSPNDTVFYMLCTMGLFAILSSTMSKSPVLKPFASSLGTTDELLGFVASASTIPGMLVSLPAASLSDILGRKRFLLLAAFVFASAPFLYQLVAVWWQLILVRFYHGFATAIFVPVAEASIAELFPNKRGERISLFTSATYVGRVVAPALGGYILLVSVQNFRVLYLAVAIAGVTALITALPLVFRADQTASVQHSGASDIVRGTTARLFHGWRTLAHNRLALTTSIVQASQYYAYGSAEFFLAGYLPDVAHLNEFLTGIVLTSIVFIAIFARPYMGRVSDRIGRKKPIAIGCVVSALPLAAVPFVSDFWVLLLLALVYGIGFASVTASTSALISEAVPGHLVGASMGFLDTVMDVGQTLGPIVSGFILASSLQYAGVFPSLSLVTIASLLMFLVLGTGGKGSKAESAASVHSEGEQ